MRFDDLCSLLESLGFDKRVKGSHHLFRRAGIEEKSICSERAATLSRIEFAKSAPCF